MGAYGRLPSHPFQLSYGPMRGKTDPQTDGPRDAAPAEDTAPPIQADTLPRLIAEHNRALHAFLMMRVRDEQEAREVAQEAYVQMLQLHQPGAVNFMRAYLFKTASNIAINRAKQRRTRQRLDQAGGAEPPVDRLTPEHRVLAAQELTVLRRALFELAPKCRRAFVLYRLRDWSYEQIAGELGVQPRMVRHYLTHAGLYCKLRVQGLSCAQAREKTKTKAKVKS